MTKYEIVERLAEENDISRADVKRCVQGTLDLISDTIVEEGRMELRNFGVFEVKKRKARKAKNPKTMEEVFVPERKEVTFKEGKRLRERLRGIRQ